MTVVQVSHIAKSFGAAKAVRDVDFQINKGEIFGLLGPNGAGKTTTIRLMLDIFKPDRGEVSILDGPMTEAKKNRIGYMPEERGLYQDMALESCLIYLATLKGLSKNDARQRLQPYLERFDLAQHRRNKVKELSRGMQQKGQIINTILHEPELLIVDEPFSGLDPVNTRLAKEVFFEMHERGATIIMSTHMMHQVEELCDRIVLINEGRNVLYGKLRDIRRHYAGDAILIHPLAELPPLPGVSGVIHQNGDVRLSLAEGVTPQSVLQSLVSQQVPLDKFEIATPTLDEIFVRTVTDELSQGLEIPG